MNLPDAEHDLLLLQGLIEAFERLGITVEFANLSFDDIKGKGGLARIHNRRIIVLDRNLSTREMNELLASELARMDVEGLFLSPIVREAVEKFSLKNV